MEEIQKNLIVQVRVYKGQVTFNEKQELTSTNQLMKLRYGIKEWTLFLKGIVQMGWTRVDVVKCLNGNSRIMVEGVINHPEVDVPEAVKDEIKKAMVVKEKQLTPDQQKIKDLEAKLDQLIESKEDPKEAIKNTEEVDEELTAARERYVDAFGKKPHHKSSAEKINQLVEEKLNETGGAE